MYDGIDPKYPSANIPLNGTAGAQGNSYNLTLPQRFNVHQGEVLQISLGVHGSGRSGSRGNPPGGSLCNSSNWGTWPHDGYQCSASGEAGEHGQDGTDGYIKIMLTH